MTRVLALSLATAAAIAAPALADTSFLAGDISVAPATTQSSTTTRADVRAQIGRTEDTEWMRQHANPFENTGYTRAQARADYLKFRSESSPMTGEDSGSMYLAQRAASASSTRAMGAAPR